MATIPYPPGSTLKQFSFDRLFYCQSMDGMGLVVGLGYDKAHARSEWQQEYKRVYEMKANRAKPPLVAD
jgi:hypothetical protein